MLFKIVCCHRGLQQLALRVMNRILASRKVCELFSDAGLAKWLGKAMGYFQSEM